MTGQKFGQMHTKMRSSTHCSRSGSQQQKEQVQYQETNFEEQEWIPSKRCSLRESVNSRFSNKWDHPYLQKLL